MRTVEARLTEIQLAGEKIDGGQLTAWIDCPATAVPAPGQYVMAFSPMDALAAAATALFRGEVSFGLETTNRGFLAAPPFPITWAPGTSLVLRGPLGRGFNLSGQRLALAALGSTAVRLLPLARETLQRGDAVTLFTDAPLPALPSSMEIYPLASLPDALAWADCMAIDLPLEALPTLRVQLGLEKGVRLMLPAQVLIDTPMPCAGLAECGACAVPASAEPARAGSAVRLRRRRPPTWRAFRLACVDGPVFDLEELEW